MGRPRKTLTVDEAAALMHITHKRILKLLVARRIYGAKKIGARWFIPTPIILLRPKRKKRKYQRRLDNKDGSKVDSSEVLSVQHGMGNEKLLQRTPML